MKRRQSQSGYTLLMTVLLLAVAAVIITGLSKTSLYAAVNAQKSSLALQNKWAILSLNKAISQTAPKLFENNLKNFQAQAEDEVKSFIIGDETAIKLDDLKRKTLLINLGDNKYRIIVVDEHSKLEVNQLLGHDPTHRHAKEIISIAVGNRAPSSQLNITPLSQKDHTKHSQNRLDNLSQVFNNLSPSELSPVQYTNPISTVITKKITQNLTCHTQGKLRYLTAPDSVIKAQAQHKKIDPQAIQALLKLKNKNPNLPLNKQLSLLKKQGIDSTKGIDKMFKPQSTCLSIWIISPNITQVTYNLSIINKTKNGKTELIPYQW